MVLGQPEDSCARTLAMWLQSPPGHPKQVSRLPNTCSNAPTTRFLFGGPCPKNLFPGPQNQVPRLQKTCSHAPTTWCLFGGPAPKNCPQAPKTMCPGLNKPVPMPPTQGSQAQNLFSNLPTTGPFTTPKKQEESDGQMPPHQKHPSPTHPLPQSCLNLSESV